MSSIVAALLRAKTRRALRSRDEITQLRAIYAVARLGAAAAPLIPDLLSVLDAPCRDDHRVVVVSALHRMGPIAAAAGPWLAARAGAEPSVTYRVYYASAHWRVTGIADVALPIWNDALAGGDEGLWALVAAVNLIGKEAAAAWALFEARVTPAATAPVLQSLAHIATVLLGHDEARRALAGPLGEAGAARILEELEAQRAAD